MGPSAGATQEKQGVNRNVGQQQQDILGQNQAIQKFGAAVEDMKPSTALAQTDVDRMGASVDDTGRSVDKTQQAVDVLGAMPGYTPSEVAAMKAEDAGKTHAAYGGAIEEIKRNAAAGGGDAGEYTQLQKLAQDRALATRSGENNIEAQAARASLQGRRLLPQEQAAVTQGRGLVTAGRGATEGAQSDVTRQLGSEASLQFEPAQLYANQYQGLGQQNVGYTGQMSKTNPFLDFLKQGMATTGQVLAARARP